MPPEKRLTDNTQGCQHAVCIHILRVAIYLLLSKCNLVMDIHSGNNQTSVVVLLLFFIFPECIDFWHPLYLHTVHVKILFA